MLRKDSLIIEQYINKIKDHIDQILVVSEAISDREKIIPLLLPTSPIKKMCAQTR